MIMYKGGLWLVALFNIKYNEHVQIVGSFWNTHNTVPYKIMKGR